jgi:hypothetical protein
MVNVFGCFAAEEFASTKLSMPQLPIQWKSQLWQLHIRKLEREGHNGRVRPESFSEEPFQE